MQSSTSHGPDNSDLPGFDQCDPLPAYVGFLTPPLTPTKSTTESGEEKGDISDEASSLSDTQSLPKALGHQFVPDGREDVTRTINRFFTGMDVAFAENTRATAIPNGCACGGVAFQFQSVDTDGASREVGHSREKAYHTNDFASLVKRYVQHYGASRSLPPLQSSSSNDIEKDDEDTNTDLNQMIDIEALLYAASTPQPSIF